MAQPLDTDLPVHPSTGLTALGVIGGRPVWPVLGGAPDDEDQDEKDTGDEDAPAEDTDADEDAPGAGADEDQDADDEDTPLGPKGEKALAAEKARRRAEAKRRRELEAELDKLRNGDGKADDPDTIRRQAEQAATAKANTRLLRAEVRAVAAGKLADPKDALRFLDLDQFEVDENGDVDNDEIADAITDLINRKPYLAAAPAKRFQGTGDGGARTGSRPKQISSREELAKMSPAARLKAHQDGRLKNLLQN
ncbi:hypothetical protein [Nocardiopsis synnemataformans]|uniref:hypothetical protein n=1 Tax=Nocardiopsis synnemataformans TaxID=61305 RepID=UPI003EBB6C07